MRELKQSKKNPDKAAVDYFQHGASKENAIAYCHYRKHVGYLSPTLIQQHQCLEKQCPFLEKYELKSYWIKRDIIRILKKYHKNGDMGKICINGTQYLADDIDTLYNICRKHIDTTGEKPLIEYIKPEVSPVHVIRNEKVVAHKTHKKKKEYRGSGEYQSYWEDEEHQGRLTMEVGKLIQDIDIDN